MYRLEIDLGGFACELNGGGQKSRGKQRIHPFECVKLLWTEIGVFIIHPHECVNRLLGNFSTGRKRTGLEKIMLVVISF